MVDTVEDELEELEVDLVLLDVAVADSVRPPFKGRMMIVSLSGAMTLCPAPSCSHDGVWAPFSGVNAVRAAAEGPCDLECVEGEDGGREGAPGPHSASSMPCPADTGSHSGL